jgi:hypothetical protein
MDEGDRGVPLTAHLRGEAERGTVVVRTAVPDSDDDAICWRPIAVRLRSRLLTVD